MYNYMALYFTLLDFCQINSLLTLQIFLHGPWKHCFCQSRQIKVKVRVLTLSKQITLLYFVEIGPATLIFK